ncbi:MAG TPA: transcriptional regulator GutM [Nocardioides sp.]|jgi:glucitol operon activator protein|nr:transcriptional regulator GutM [Nocardioides sp.]
MTGVWFWLIVAVVAGWMVQLYVTYRQATAFNAEVRKLRAQGTVSVGAGGTRYRGGRAFVAIAVDEHDVVADAITLQGFTTFARARALPALRGQRVSRLGGESEVPDVSHKQREAARQAATLFVQARDRATRGHESGEGVVGTTG